MLTATLSPRRLREVLRAQPLPDGWRFALNDARQIVIVTTEDPDPFMGQPVTARMAQESAAASEGWFPNVSKDGGAIYAAFYRSPLTGWATVANVPRAAVDGPSNRTLATMVGGALVVAGASVGLALWLGRRLARDVAQFRDAAVALRHGGAPAIPPTRGDRVARRGRGSPRDRRSCSRRRRTSAPSSWRGSRHARAEADRLNAAKDEFLAMLGHELRNPLGAIAGAAAILDRIGKPDDAAEAARAVIARQVRHLTALVDDLLDVARVTSGKIRLSRQPVNLGALVERTLQTFTAAGHAAGHQPIVSVTSVWVDADATRIEQVVTNLVENAVKFTPVVGTIAVSVRREGPSAVLEVRDTGRGIAPTLLPHVFDLFAQGDAAPDRAPGGLGLGLTLVDRLVALHGGTVTADSPGLGQGATFTVRLPAIDEPIRLTDTAAPLPAGRPRRILVIEDHEDTREGLRTLLTLEGHDVTGAPGWRAGHRVRPHEPAGGRDHRPRPAAGGRVPGGPALAGERGHVLPPPGGAHGVRATGGSAAGLGGGLRRVPRQARGARTPCGRRSPPSHRATAWCHRPGSTPPACQARASAKCRDTMRALFVSQDNDVATALPHLGNRTRHHPGERSRPLHPRIVDHAPWDEELVTKDRAVMHAE